MTDTARGTLSLCSSPTSTARQPAFPRLLLLFHLMSEPGACPIVRSLVCLYTLRTRRFISFAVLPRRVPQRSFSLSFFPPFPFSFSFFFLSFFLFFFFFFCFSSSRENYHSGRGKITSLGLRFQKAAERCVGTHLRGASETRFRTLDSIIVVINRNWYSRVRVLITRRNVKLMFAHCMPPSVKRSRQR